MNGPWTGTQEWRGLHRPSVGQCLRALRPLNWSGYMARGLVLRTELYVTREPVWERDRSQAFSLTWSCQSAIRSRLLLYHWQDVMSNVTDKAVGSLESPCLGALGATSTSRNSTQCHTLKTGYQHGWRHWIVSSSRKQVANSFYCLAACMELVRSVSFRDNWRPYSIWSAYHG